VLHSEKGGVRIGTTKGSLLSYYFIGISIQGREETRTHRRKLKVGIMGNRAEPGSVVSLERDQESSYWIVGV
jgi:hypothetical protein